jgi:hypothetical protein
MDSLPATGRQSRLQAFADEGNDFVLVGHSQGKMFANVAHDGLRDKRPDAKRAVVHLALVSPTLRGDYMTADIDLVINGLINFGRDIVKPSNFWIFGGRGSDPLGHKLAETCLDEQREGSTNAQGQALDQVAYSQAICS